MLAPPTTDALGGVDRRPAELEVGKRGMVVNCLGWIENIGTFQLMPIK